MNQGSPSLLPIIPSRVQIISGRCSRSRRVRCPDPDRDTILTESWPSHPPDPDRSDGRDRSDSEGEGGRMEGIRSRSLAHWGLHWLENSLFIHSNWLFGGNRELRETVTRRMPNNFTRKTSTIQKHPYHSADPSPRPLVPPIPRPVTATGAAMFMHSFQNGDKILFLGISMVIRSMFVRRRDVIREATFNGYHTRTVQYGLRLGMVLFTVPEAMSPFASFRASLHSSPSPAIEIGAI